MASKDLAASCFKRRGWLAARARRRDGAAKQKKICEQGRRVSLRKTLSSRAGVKERGCEWLGKKGGRGDGGREASGVFLFFLVQQKKKCKGCQRSWAAGPAWVGSGDSMEQQNIEETVIGQATKHSATNELHKQSNTLFKYSVCVGNLLAGVLRLRKFEVIYFRPLFIRPWISH